ncbi:UNVERIFIED_CONTAM: hypothetical protein K2H54_019847 [Gekko kuhli]
MHELFPEYPKEIKPEDPQLLRDHLLKLWMWAPIKKLPEKFPEGSGKDVNEWPEGSTSYPRKKGPQKTSKLNAEEGPHMSMSSIQEWRRPYLSKQNLVMGEREGSTICQMSKTTQNMHELFPEYPKEMKPEVPQLPRDHLQKGWIWAPIKEPPEKYVEASKRNVNEWPEASTSYPRKKGPQKTSKLNAEEGPHMSRSSIQEWRRPDLSKQNLLMGEREGSTICQMKYPKEIKPEVPQLPRDHRQKLWIWAPIKKLPEKYPEGSGKDVNEWPEGSTSYPQKKGPQKTSKLNAEEGPHMSRSSIQEWRRPDLSKQNLLMGEREGATICQMSKTTQNMHELFPEYPKEMKPEVPQLPRDHLQKGWIWAPIKKPPEKSAEASKRNVNEWPEASTSYPRKKGPQKTSKLNAEEGPHMSWSSIQEWRRPDLSKQNLLMGEREGATICQMSKTTQNMHELFPEYPKEMKPEVPQFPRDHLQKGWIWAPIKKPPEKYAEASKRNVNEWPEASTSYPRKKGPQKTSKLNAEEWPHMSMSSIQEW